MTSIWQTERCSVCGKGFTEESWNDRHTDDEGGDCHPKCCTFSPECRAGRRREREEKRRVQKP